MPRVRIPHLLIALIAFAGIAGGFALAQDLAPTPTEPVAPPVEPADPDTPDTPVEPGSDPAEDEAALADKVAELVEALRSEDFETRTTAEEALLELGPNAIPHLREHLEEADTVDLQVRLESIIATIEDAATERNNPPNQHQHNHGGQVGPLSATLTIITSDDEAKYEYQQMSDGSIRFDIEWKDDDREPEHYEFESRAEFEEALPKYAERFGANGFGLRFRFGTDEADPEDGPVITPEDDPDDGEDGDGDQGEVNPFGPTQPDLDPRMAELFQRLLNNEISPEEFQREMDRLFRDPFDRDVPDAPNQPDPNRPGHDHDDDDDPFNVPNPWNGNPPWSNDDPNARPGDDGTVTPDDGDAVELGGVILEDLSPNLRSQLRIDEAEGGVLVASVEDEDAFLAMSGVQRYDVILTVNGVAFADAEQLREFILALPAGEAVTLHVYRGRGVGEIDLTFVR